MLIVALTMASNFTTTLAKVAFTADNLDELVSKPSYGSITNYNSTLTMSSIAKPVIVELDMLIEEVLAQQEVRSLPYYELLTREFFLGFPCVESSGIMVFKTDVKNPSLFKDLVFKSENETIDGYETKVKGIFQIKGAGSGTRWLRNQFNSVYKPALVNFDNPPRPNQFYIPDVVYSIALSFGDVEFGNVYRRYGEYINKYANICGLTQSQRNEVAQSLACAVYHGQSETGGSLDYPIIRETLSAYLCYAIKDLGTFKNLAPFAGDDMHSTVRKVILGDDSHGGMLNDKYRGKIKLTDGTYLEKSLIQHVSDKYMNGLTMEIYETLYRENGIYQSQFANYTYGIGSIACGTMRVQTIEQFKSLYNADVSNNPQFLKVQEYMRSNGLNYTKKFVNLLQIADQTGGFSVDMTEITVNYLDEPFTFPMFVYDSGRRKDGGRIELRYDIAQHLSARGFLYDLPDQLCKNGKNTGDLSLTCDIRVIPALHAMSKAWELYDSKYGKTGQKLEVVSAHRTYEKSIELMIMWANDLALAGRNNWTLADAQYIIDNAYTEGGSLFLSSTAQQLRIYASEPGKSAHFTGRVFDFNISENPKVYDWLVKHASSFGFYPYSAERWHWEYNPERTWLEE